MAIKTVQIQINGDWYSLTETSTPGTWEATATAPNQTSYNLPGGYYPVTVQATNEAGTTTTATATTPTIGESLRLIVEEKIAPVINFISPTNGAYISNNQPNIVLEVVDEAGGSGINLSSLSVQINGTAATNISNSPIDNGYMITVVPPVLEDGENTVIVNVSDNDGNAAQEATLNFTVDTAPPNLTVYNPANNAIVNTPQIVVNGITNDSTSSSVSVTITVNSGSAVTADVGSDGAFSETITLSEGANTIQVVATDAAGQKTTVTRSVTLDTSVPKIVAAYITPNPADTGETVVIRVVVE